jgi:hypothetical protein
MGTSGKFNKRETQILLQNSSSSHEKGLNCTYTWKVDNERSVDTAERLRRYENLSSQSNIQFTFQAIKGNETCDCGISVRMGELASILSRVLCSGNIALTTVQYS